MKEILLSGHKNIALSDIDVKPGPFCMSFGFNLEPLKVSIKKFGVINSPYLLRSTDNHFSVVSGYKRLLAVRELGWKDIVCHVLPDTFSLFNAFLFNLHDNLINRQLNAIEKGMVLQGLTRFLSTEEIVAGYMPMLGLPPNIRQLELFLNLEELEEKIKISIAIDQLSIKVADFMKNLSSIDRLKIFNLFTSFKWSFNQQWEVIHWIKEIAGREGRSIAEIIDTQEIKRAINNTKMNRPQKVKAIVKILKTRRFPSLSTAEEFFNKQISSLSLPAGVTVIPPSFFEGTNYKLEVTFSNGENLKEKLAMLSILPGLEEITHVWTGKNTDEPI